MGSLNTTVPHSRTLVLSVRKSSVNNDAAYATRPIPGSKLYALIGHSSAAGGFVYELLEASSDNSFVVIHTFQEATGWFGSSQSGVVDTDCDALDEFLLTFFSKFHRVGVGPSIRFVR